MREPQQRSLSPLSMVYPSSNAQRMRSVRLLSGFLLMLFGCGSRHGPYQRKDGAWYFNDLRVAEKGPEDFVPLLGPFAKSSVAGYYRGRAVPDSDGPSFAALSEHYAKDKGQSFIATPSARAENTIRSCTIAQSSLKVPTRQLSNT
jgi:hypothetical protein